MLSAMNGIAEASAEFFELMATIFKSIGYKQTCGDKAFWFKRNQDHFILLLLSTDDIHVSTNQKYLYEELQVALETKFQPKNVKTYLNCEKFIGINMISLPSGAIWTHQNDSIDKMAIEHFPNLDRSKSTFPKQPISKAYENSIKTGISLDSTPCNPTMFRHGTGQIISITKTRIDVLYGLKLIASKQANPDMSDYKALMQLLLYAIGTPELGLTYNPSNDENIANLIKLYSLIDASYNHYSDSRSHSGYYQSFDSTGNGSFNTVSKKASTVATSTTESEHDSVFEWSKANNWTRDMLECLGLATKQPSTGYDDSQSNINIIQNPKATLKKTRHYTMRVDYLLLLCCQVIIQIKKSSYI
jgi:hypothetical protein